MMMSYEKEQPGATGTTQLKHVPEFSSFVANIRFSQLIREKINSLNRNLKKVQKEKQISPAIALQINEIEAQMDELVRIRNTHFTGKKA